MTVRGRALGVLVAACCTLAGAEERVSFPSLDGAGNAPVVLTGYFFAAPSPAAPAASSASVASTAPASPARTVVLLHGCGGLHDKNGALTARYADYAALFNGAGVHALLVDSLTPRYEKEICTQKIGKRRITQAHRRLDALGAVAYLAGRSDVDASRIGLVGWSNGGSTVLAATNLRHRDVAGAAVRPAFAVAFYPGCEADLKRGFEPAAPLLMLVGEADDWTAAAPCRALAAAAAAPKPQIDSYAGAYHGFDSDLPVRVRKDVPNGVHPGQGVHLGGNAVAWRKSRARLLQFLAAQP